VPIFLFLTFLLETKKLKIRNNIKNGRNLHYINGVVRAFFLEETTLLPQKLLIQNLWYT
jgi:hypothetical protein